MKKAMVPFKVSNMEGLIWLDVLQINSVIATERGTSITLIGDPDPYIVETPAEEVIQTIKANLSL